MKYLFSALFFFPFQQLSKAATKDPCKYLLCLSDQWFNRQRGVFFPCSSLISAQNYAKLVFLRWKQVIQFMLKWQNNLKANVYNGEKNLSTWLTLLHLFLSETCLFMTLIKKLGHLTMVIPRNLEIHESIWSLFSWTFTKHSETGGTLLAHQTCHWLYVKSLYP